MVSSQQKLIEEINVPPFIPSGIFPLQFQFRFPGAASPRIICMFLKRFIPDASTVSCINQYLGEIQ